MPVNRLDGMNWGLIDAPLNLITLFIILIFIEVTLLGAAVKIPTSRLTLIILGLLIINPISALAWGGQDGRYGGYNNYGYNNYGYNNNNYNYGYAPRVMTIPPMYAHQAAPAAEPVPVDYRYYCQATNDYFPYVRECSAGWQHANPVARQ